MAWMVRAAPMRAPGMAPMMRATATRPSTWPSRAWVIVPGMAKAPTHTSEVAMADFTSMRASCTKAGTMITPPPMPSRPDRQPATAPIEA